MCQPVFLMFVWEEQDNWLIDTAKMNESQKVINMQHLKQVSRCCQGHVLQP